MMKTKNKISSSDLFLVDHVVWKQTLRSAKWTCTTKTKNRNYYPNCLQTSVFQSTPRSLWSCPLTFFMCSEGSLTMLGMCSLSALLPNKGGRIIWLSGCHQPPARFVATCIIVWPTGRSLLLPLNLFHFLFSLAEPQFSQTSDLICLDASL